MSSWGRFEPVEVAFRLPVSGRTSVIRVVFPSPASTDVLGHPWTVKWWAGVTRTTDRRPHGSSIFGLFATMSYPQSYPYVPSVVTGVGLRTSAIEAHETAVERARTTHHQHSHQRIHRGKADTRNDQPIRKEIIVTPAISPPAYWAESATRGSYGFANWAPANRDGRKSRQRHLEPPAQRQSSSRPKSSLGARAP